MEYIINSIIITLILLFIAISGYYVFKKDSTIRMDNEDCGKYHIQYLLNGIKDTFNEILNTNPADLNLNKTETIKQEKRKAKLRKELRTCNYGDLGAKEYIKEYIKDLLQIKYGINEENIDQTMPFRDFARLTPGDKFDILLYCYKKQYGTGALEAFIQTYELDKLNQGDRYEYLSNQDLYHNNDCIIDGDESDEYKSYYKKNYNKTFNDSIHDNNYKCWMTDEVNEDYQYGQSENSTGYFENQYTETEAEKQGGARFEISVEDINYAFMTEIGTLSFGDKLDIVSQRIYQLYKGHGVIDEIRDMDIDGVSAGVSGLSNVFYHFTEEMLQEEYESLPNSYDSIWIFYHGKTIHLSFLGFGSKRELERVCKNIYRYNNPGQLSSAKGYIANEMKDGSRIIVVRPPLTENWAFFVRKFDSIKKVKANSLIIDKNNYIPIEVMKWLIKGCQVIGITGEQGCGKTTLLKALVEYINPIFTLRIQELIFELNLRKLYPYRNILSFRETGTVSGQEALNLQKKTDGVVTILGEVATAPVARWLVQLSQVASKFTIFTHHAKTTESLIINLRNALLQDGGFTNEMVAEEQVVVTVNFDIHMVKTVEGHRYIERITEILPLHDEDMNIEDLEMNMSLYYKQMTRRHMFRTVDIVRFEDDRYVFKNKPSRQAIQSICYNLSKEEQEVFHEFLNRF
jgi:pilus assembly protein CpaF